MSGIVGLFSTYRGLFAGIAFVFGAAAGSFLNVCIWRLPRGESLLRPRSHCTSCNAPISWRDNIPLVSYIVLRGRCRSCGARFSARYIGVEALTAGIFALLAWRVGPDPAVLPLVAFSCALIVVTFIDLDHRIIPDEITLGGLPLAVAASVLVPRMHLSLAPFSSWIPSVRLAALASSGFGLLAGGGLLWGLAVAYERLVLARRGPQEDVSSRPGWEGELEQETGGREAMGGGDVKLLALVGAALGWQGALLAVMLGSLLGSVVGVMRWVLFRGKYLPFGPFISFGAFVSAVWGRDILLWYLGLAGGSGVPGGAGG